jgi:hypothetical protein
VEQHDHRTRRLPDDPVDQSQRVLRALAEPDKRNVGPFPGRHGADVLDLDLARDDLVSQRDDSLRDEREAILALVRDQDA